MDHFRKLIEETQLLGSNQEQVERTIGEPLATRKKSSEIGVRKSTLQGDVQLPPSKSHTIRAILLAAMAQGTSFLYHLLNSPDTTSAIQAARQLGATITPISSGLAIRGVAGSPCVPSQVIDAGNSGQVLRFAGALAALADGYTVITGDESIRFNRPIQSLIEGLCGLKAWAVSSRQNGFAPLIVRGPLVAATTTLNGEDSQPVSALLMAASFVEGKTEIQVRETGEKPWLALTLSWLDRLGVSYFHRNFEYFTVTGKKFRPAFEVTIPGDLSALAFPLAAALVTQSTLTIHQVNLQDVQGDKALVFLLQQMGARLEIHPSKQLLKVFPSGKLKGRVIDVNSFIDAVPILAVIGCFAEGETVLIHASIARQKESNRLACMATELQKMGAEIKETADGLRIHSSSLKGGCVNSHGDHRIAMALLVAGLGSEGETEVQNIECINKSYPTFIEDLGRLGAIVD